MKRLIWVLLVVMGCHQLSAQEVYTSSGKPGYHKKNLKKKKGYDPDKLILGGGINFGLSDGYFSVGLSPIVGYRITDRFSAGIGLGYLYSRAPVTYDPNNPSKLLYETENLFYPNVWARFFVYHNWFVSSAVEYDFISQTYPLDNYGNVNKTRLNLNNTCLWLGVGSKVPMGGRLSMYWEVVYDVLQGANSPYLNGVPDIRIGVAAGL
jgi:hypothetical protein